MSIYDDMFDLDDHFKKLVKNNTSAGDTGRERKGLKKAWERISQSHADMERAEMKTQPVMEAIGTILHQFEVLRGYEDIKLNPDAKL